jgi:hypothetical protein
VKIDFSNAFNEASRSNFLNELVHTLPSLSQLAYWCYGKPTNLYIDGKIILSSTGVQQGDPIGPLLFCLGLLPLTKRIS